MYPLIPHSSRLPSFLDGLLQQLLQRGLLLVVQRDHLVHLGAVGFLHDVLILWREKNNIQQLNHDIE